MSNLTTEEMIEASDIFVESYKYVMNNLIAESKTKALTFVADLVLRHKPYMLITKEFLPFIVDTVFKDIENRDFILHLHFVFFGRFGNNDDYIKGLASNLARGIGISNVKDINAIPAPINDRLIDETDAIELLTSNKWLIIILLLQLLITIDSGR